jgi:hypothetical protein
MAPLQVLARPVGSVELHTWNWLRARQVVADGHVAEYMAPCSCATSATFHAPGPPVGSVEEATRPSPSPESSSPSPTAIHIVVVAQLTESRRLTPGRCAGLDQAAAPPVGSVDVRIDPDPPAATQNVMVGHDTLPKPSKLVSTPVVVTQAAAPPVGSVDVTMSPPDVTTHKVVDGHEIAPPVEGIAFLTMCQEPAAAGFVEKTTSPDPGRANRFSATPTHRLAAGQETLDKPVGTTGGAVSDHDLAPSVGSTEATSSPQ